MPCQTVKTGHPQSDQDLHRMLIHQLIICSYREKVPLNMYKMRRFRSSCACTKYHPGLALFVCVEVLQPSQPNGVMLSAVNLPNHTFTGQA